MHVQATYGFPELVFSSLHRRVRARSLANRTACGDFCTIAILSNVPSLYAESSRVSVLSVAFLISIQTLRLPLASFRPHLFPFRSQFLVEGSVPPRFVRLVTPELLHLSLFNLIPSLFDFLSHKFLFSSFSAGFFSSNTSKKVSR